MKELAIIFFVFLIAVLLSGCAMPGLSINADFTISGTYRSDVPLGGRIEK